MMDSGRELSRRDFHRLSAAALGGLASGALVGCQRDSSPAGANVTAATDKDAHVCGGLNQCKATGHACAGQGQCATVAAHVCAAKNSCKGQGGCGAAPGENACKGEGGCAVPLADHAWKTARENFEKRMKTAGKPFGPAPGKKESGPAKKG
jgi:hypothetical protein